MEPTDLRGLTREEAARRLAEFGPNALKGKKPKSLFRRLLDQLNDLLIFILLAAAAVSAALGEPADAVIILLVVVVNAVVGVLQEAKADRALAALRTLAAPRAVVRRDGVTEEIDSRDVVPGDLVVVESGRVIPADVRWLEAASLKVEEAALTGESVPVDKTTTVGDSASPLGDRRWMGFQSTTVVAGRGLGLVEATGMATQIGAIARLLDEGEPEPTPLQKGLTRFGQQLGIGILVLCAGLFAWQAVQALLTAGTVGEKQLFEFFLVAVSLAVAAIPEGLAAIVTIVLALGVQKMSRSNAIVRRLPSVETLGSVTFICSDKTGTLTQNKMSVTRHHADPSGEALLARTLVLCNDATWDGVPSGDPTEVALGVFGSTQGQADARRSLLRVAEVPFDSERKLMTTVHHDSGRLLACTKGSAEALLARCTHFWKEGQPQRLAADDRAALLATTKTWASEALRVLGAAVRWADSAPADPADWEADLCFVGLVGLIDPPRLEVKASIAACHQSGIETVMITGDHRDTAFAIARELGIAQSSEQVLSGSELDALDDSALAIAARTVRVFARVTPQHKVRIVRAFQSGGAIVSMTGDGVNDAPSLQAADIGVAMGKGGTDVAKGASDLILADDNFQTIVKAIEEGRRIYANIQKAVYFLLSCNTGEILAIFGGIVVGLGSPLLPIHILWVNLVTDTLPALALCMEPEDPHVLKQRPRDPQEGLFARGGWRFIGLYGILVGAVTLAAFVLGGGGEVGETMAFGVLAFSQLAQALNLRHRTSSVFQLGLFSNRPLVGALAVCLLLQLAVMVLPPVAEAFRSTALGWNSWLTVASLSLVPLLVGEAVKLVLRRT